MSAIYRGSQRILLMQYVGLPTLAIVISLQFYNHSPQQLLLWIKEKELSDI